MVADIMTVGLGVCVWSWSKFDRMRTMDVCVNMDDRWGLHLENQQSALLVHFQHWEVNEARTMCG
jgi:hypothetical protein